MYYVFVSVYFRLFIAQVMYVIVTISFHSGILLLGFFITTMAKILLL